MWDSAYDSGYDFMVISSTFLAELAGCIFTVGIPEYDTTVRSLKQSPDRGSEIVRISSASVQL